MDNTASEVTYELAPEGQKVRLVLTHRRLGDDRERNASVSAGWHTHLGILRARLEGEAPAPFWSTHTQLEASYTAQLAAMAATPKAGAGVALRIVVTSVLVDDQDKALKFYTEKLGFVKKTEVPLGEYKWLTVVSPYTPDGVEVLLEPNANPAAKTFQAAVKEQGIPITMFGVDDIRAVCAKLKQSGVILVREPTQMGPVTIATIDDTCGNLVQLVQK